MEKSHVGMFQCYFCGKDMGVVLDRRLRNTLPMQVGVMDMEPCDECKDWMKKGILLMSIRDDTTPEDMKGHIPNPYRTGGWVVVTEEAAIKMFEGEEVLDFAIKHRFIFVLDAAWDALGLPRGRVDLYEYSKKK